jgi:hypothetical protein
LSIPRFVGQQRPRGGEQSSGRKKNALYVGFLALIHSYYFTDKLTSWNKHQLSIVKVARAEELEKQWYEKTPQMLS